jgi:hypothetical protein
LRRAKLSNEEVDEEEELSLPLGKKGICRKILTAVNNCRIYYHASQYTN